MPTTHPLTLKQRAPLFAYGRSSYELQLDGQPGVEPHFTIVRWDLDRIESTVVARIDPHLFGVFPGPPTQSQLVPPILGGTSHKNRAGRRWTSQEDSLMEHLSLAGWSHGEISQELNRSTRSVTDRLRTLGVGRFR